MKIGRTQLYSLIGGVTLAAAAGFGLKKCNGMRQEEKQQAKESMEYIKQYAPDEYKEIYNYVDTAYISDPYIIDRIWINNANKIRDSLQTK